jgi:Asp/Glu/hydantoin racemase
VGTFVDQARDLIKAGADVILPMGITQCPVHIKPDWLMDQLGVPVVEGIGAPIRLAAILVALKLRYSRAYWPKSPLHR